MADSQSFFPPPPALLLFYSSPFISLSLSSAHSPGSSELSPATPHPHPLPPSSLHHTRSFPPILSGLIVLHLFIQAFMAASSSCRPISPPDDGFLPQLSWLFIIYSDPHRISLTLGRWFSHWTSLRTRRITNLLRSSRKHTCAHAQSDTVRKETSHHWFTKS